MYTSISYRSIKILMYLKLGSFVSWVNAGQFEADGLDKIEDSVTLYHKHFPFLRVILKTTNKQTNELRFM